MRIACPGSCRSGRGAPPASARGGARTPRGTGIVCNRCRKSRMRVTLEAVAAAALLAHGIDALSASPPPALALSACEIEHPLLHTVIEAECAVLSVAENPHLPA